jgi:DNA end-binding protein Ku
VLLHHEEVKRRLPTLGPRTGERLRGPGGIALLAISLEAVWRHSPGARWTAWRASRRYNLPMAPRSIATGTISFGLVSIPVRLYAATQPSAQVSFNLLHAKDGSRLKQQYVCARDGEKVEREEMVKGFEFAKDRYVTFTGEELKALEEIATQTIEIAEFVPASQVDPVYFDRAYHLGPDKGGAKAYRLLVEALARSGKAALARYASRGKQYLVLIRPAEGRLVMQQLYYADEVRSVEEIPLDDVEIKDGEVQLALQLIEQTTTDGFHPERYEDAVRKRTLEAIERKVQGQEIQAGTPAEPSGEVIDIMEALKASLEAARSTAREGSAPPRGPEKGEASGPDPRPRRKAPLRAAERDAESRPRAGSASRK